jgi:hypothetical protein
VRARARTHSSIPLLLLLLPPWHAPSTLVTLFFLQKVFTYKKFCGMKILEFSGTLYFFENENFKIESIILTDSYLECINYLHARDTLL